MTRSSRACHPLSSSPGYGETLLLVMANPETLGISPRMCIIVLILILLFLLQDILQPLLFFLLLLLVLLPSLHKDWLSYSNWNPKSSAGNSSVNPPWVYIWVWVLMIKAEAPLIHVNLFSLRWKEFLYSFTSLTEAKEMVEAMFGCFQVG